MESQDEKPAENTAKTGEVWQSSHAMRPDRIPSTWSMGRTPWAKLLILCVLAALLNIPLLSVWSLQKERSRTAAEAASEIGQMSGGEQTVIGPLIVLPYLINANDFKGEVRRTAVFLPDNLIADNAMSTEIRHRSIFQLPVYRNELKLKASFKPINVAEISSIAIKPLWDEAVVAMEIADTRGITSQVVADFGSGQTAEFQSGTPAGLRSGIQAPLSGIDLSKPFDVSIDMRINGSASFSMSALGRTSEISLKSDWKHPSFRGRYLPEQRTIDEQGFSAVWRSSALARSLPAVFTVGEGRVSLDSETVTVGLYTPADLYQQVERALKYGLLFVGGMFLAVFGLEMASRGRLHVAQYLLFGFALVLFYLLLLSFAEHVGFELAYLIASSATTALVAVYVGMALRSKVRGGLLFFILATAYGLLYMLLRMEDHSLLVGSVFVFVALAALMFATLRLDWSAIPGLARQEPETGR